MISVLNTSNPDICPQIYLQHLPNDTVLPFCHSCLRHGSSRSHWSTPNAHLGKRKKIDTCGLQINIRGLYIYITMYIWNITTILEETFRKFWDSSFSVCVCVEQHLKLDSSIYLFWQPASWMFLYRSKYMYVYIYKCDNVYMLPMSVWDVSWSFHQVLRNWLCEHFTFVTQPRDWWSQWLIVFTSTKSNN